jgi:DNA-binding transcriptional ArsR family regulator
MDVFEAIAHPVRRELLHRLVAGELPVNRLAERQGISRPAISQHLAVLLEAGLVSERKVGRERLYRYEPTPLIALDDWLERHRTSLRRALARLKTHVEKEPSGEEAPDDRAHRSHD